MAIVSIFLQPQLMCTIISGSDMASPQHVYSINAFLCHCFLVEIGH